MSDIATLARAFTLAGTQLGEALAMQLAADSPDVAAKVALAVEHGETLAIEITFSADPCIRLSAVNDYNSRRKIMQISASAATEH